jgi:hypothetical protein
MTSVPATQNCRLYLISPERLEHPAIFADDLRLGLDGGDVAAFQLRVRSVDDTTVARAADTLRRSASSAARRPSEHRRTVQPHVDRVSLPISRWREAIQANRLAIRLCRNGDGPQGTVLPAAIGNG